MAIAKVERINAARGKGPLGKAADQEPVFILRAQDLLASEVVRFWADRALVSGCLLSKVQEAYDLAVKMEQWPNRKVPD